ncbi:MAG: hypothetical protein A3C13_02745 [Candidatus Lloydbacteria bacterium RIFCSPHIGHO2_02_FULL_50_11]|nr:MAG: hypothetical protein A3C13_02745 [Candidatus Lloydbacteria bacterium RIFCSPHIGHO2_02_FULL_50_11]
MWRSPDKKSGRCFSAARLLPVDSFSVAVGLVAADGFPRLGALRVRAIPIFAGLVGAVLARSRPGGRGLLVEQVSPV